MPLSASTLLLAGTATLGAVGLAAAAAVLLARGAEARDLGDRMGEVLRGAGPRAAPTTGLALGRSLSGPLIRLGEFLRDSALVSAKDLADFQRSMTAAGLSPARAVPLFIAAKAMLLLVLPLGAIGTISAMDLDFGQGAMLLAAAFFLVVMGPNWVIGALRRPFQNNLRKGLPDALDLMVVAAEAGLGLESAVDRVAREMVGSNRAIALEFNVLVQELRLLPERRMALERMAERTGMEGFKRLSATLSQTLRYGTPLAQALRVLAAEMRQDRQLRLEEKAVRLPALLIGPLILFILPALFIALIGPSILEIGNTFGGSP
jgi:tight adherence protein C